MVTIEMLTDSASGLPKTIPSAIAAWLTANDMPAARLANAIGVDRRFLHEVLTHRRQLPDPRIRHLPQGLREIVAEIRARQYEALASLVRHCA